MWNDIFLFWKRSEGAGHSSVKAAIIICVDKSATARTIKALEEKGFARRKQDDTDKRQNRVFITQAGRNLWPAVQEELHYFNEHLTQGIEITDLETIYNGLLQMEENAMFMSNNKSSAVEWKEADNGKEQRTRNIG